MNSFNRLMLCGYLGGDPELRYTQNNTPVCNFSIAQNQRVGDEDETFWVDVEVWGKTGENIEKFFHKGDPIFLEGSLKCDTWNDKNSGAKRTKLKLKAWSFQFMRSKKEARSDDMFAPEPAPSSSLDDTPF